MSTRNQVGTSNPFTESGSRMVLQVPKEIKIKLVNSADLLNLKIWSSLASFFSNISVGFWVWYCQNTNSTSDQIIYVVSIITTIITLIFLGLAFYFNYRLKQETSEIAYSPND